MDLGALIENDFDLVMDNLEPIAIQLNRDVPEEVSIATANRSAMRRNSQAYWNVQIEDDNLMFSFAVVDFLPVSNTPNIRKKDTITDAAGNVYIVKSAQLQTLQTRWDVLCALKT